MNLIAAVDNNWGIGKNNSLLIQIPEDMQFFRATTVGNVVVMGRHTLESFPNGRPLPKRTNIVLSGKPDYEVKGATVAHSVSELKKLLADYDTDDVFIIGGESVYRQFEPYCKVAYITKIDYAYDADAHFPNLDEKENWVLHDESEEQTYFDIAYTFTSYYNEDVKEL